jgi:predicted nucleic-acid-binding protein
VVNALRALLDSTEIAVENPAVVQDAVDRWGDSKTTFADCFILAAARAAGQTPLATFDRDLGSLSGALLLQGRT